MATTEFSNFPTGSMGNLSVYKMRGVKRLIIRKKGGASRKQIQKEDRFELTRRSMQEWSGCALASKQIIRSVQAIRHLCDGGYIGFLNSIGNKLQKLDTAHSLGQRSVAVSVATYKLDGFNINRQLSFDQVLLYPLKVELDRVAGMASVEIAPLHPDVNLINARQLPWYRFIFMLGTIADVIYDEAQSRYRPSTESKIGAAVVYTPWYNAHINHPAWVHQLSLTNWTNDPSVSMVLSAGIEFGIPVSEQVIKYVKFSGVGKILRVQ